MVALRTVLAVAAGGLLTAPVGGLRAKKDSYNQFCGCQLWPTVYNTLMNGCEQLGPGMCTWFKTFNTNICVNGKDNVFGPQQCFVSHLCNTTEELNGGGKINDLVNWKVCDDTRQQKPDTLLKTYSLKNLTDMMKTMDLDVITTLHMAYPTSWLEVWENVKPFFTDGGYAQVKEMHRLRVFNKSMPKPSHVYQGLSDLVDAGLPVLFKTLAVPEQKTVFYGIMEGSSAYELTYIGKGALDESINSAMKVPENSWSGKKWKISCISSCTR